MNWTTSRHLPPPHSCSNQTGSEPTQPPYSVRNLYGKKQPRRNDYHIEITLTDDYVLSIKLYYFSPILLIKPKQQQQKLYIPHVQGCDRHPYVDVHSGWEAL